MIAPMAKPPELLTEYGAYGQALRAELLPLCQQAFAIAQSEGDAELLLVVRAIAAGLELVSLGMPILGEKLIRCAHDAKHAGRTPGMRARLIGNDDESGT
jgi:hypothetical protein